jgi:ribonuclease R
MRSFIGDDFNGIISGVTNFGVFVVLENTVEGIVKLDTLKKGRYNFDEKTFTLSSNDRSYTLGQSVTVRVLGVDMSAHKVEFKILD